MSKPYNSSKHMEKLIGVYLDNITNVSKDNKSSLEFEVKFGTGERMKRITRMDYDNVIKRILSDGYKHSGEETILRMFALRGSLTNENVRTEINGIGNVSEYCKTNRLTNLNGDMMATFVEKKDFVTDANANANANIGSRVVFNDFNFNASLKL
jgi:hypothetical protein